MSKFMRLSGKHRQKAVKAGEVLKEPDFGDMRCGATATGMFCLD